MTTDLALQALLSAVWRRKPKQRVMVHSDQGSQFTSKEWQSFLDKHNLDASMSRRGNCHDNAVAESFFQLLKRERIRRRTYLTRDAARQDAFDYIEMFYNPNRKHTNNGMLSPFDYETRQVSRKLGAPQETRCREFAKFKNYEVVKVFKEDISGKLASRPAMIDLLQFLRRYRKTGTVVIIDDISRLARGLEAHLQLRASLAKAGGRLESPSIEFGEDSGSILVENLLASVAQHQREKNGEQTKNRMRARMQNGYWVFGAPIGYKFETQSGHGKILVRDEPVASILADAMTRYATGRLTSQMEVKRFLDANPIFAKSRTTKLHQSRIADLFSRPIYAGYLSHENWGLNLIPAKHVPLISYETFLAIQKRGAVTAYAPTRKDLNEDFPLRGSSPVATVTSP